MIGSGGQHRLLSFAEALMRLGIDVELMSPYFRSDYNYFKINYNSFYIDRHKLYDPRNRLKFFIDNTLILFYKEMLSNPSDAYIIGLPSPLLRGSVSYLIWMRKIPYVLDFGDPWFSPNDPFLWRKLMDKLLISFVNLAPAIMVPNKWFKQFVISTFKQYTQLSSEKSIELDNKIHIVYPASLNIADKSSIRKRVDRDPFTIVHLGDLQSITAVKLLTYLIRQLHLYNKKVKITIIGGGRYANMVKNYVNLHRLVDKISIDIIEPITRFNVYKYLAQSHIGLSFHEGIYWKPINELKIVDYLSAGLPVLSTHNTDILINNYNGFIFNDSYTLVNFIINIIDNRDILERMSLNAVNIAEIHCSLSSVGRKILSILKYI
jgi:glycosyltransferase involved in cell wall biosynthesis